MKDYNKIRDLIVQINAIGPLEVFDGQRWFNYESMELADESLTLLVTTIEDYFTHAVLDLNYIKEFRSHNDEIKEKLKPLLLDLKELI